MTTKDSTVQFAHPEGSSITQVDGQTCVSVPETAVVALDEALRRVWRAADGRSLPGLIADLDLPAADVEPAVQALRRAGLLLPPLPLLTDAPRAPLPAAPPLVSVVIVTHNGRHHLESCLPSLAAQTYPNLEIIVVDDRSSDGSGDWLAANYPQVRVVAQTDGPNFAAGNNVGVAQAQGDYIFLLNNDTVLDPHCVQELVGAAQQGQNVGGVAAMLRLYHNPPFLNGLGTRLRRLGFGHDVGIGSLDVGQFDGVRAVPLLCFGAALIPRAAWQAVGPIETVYGFYSEDADWSYRARALGFELLAAPRARVYHKFGASTGALPSAFKQRLAVRNRLWFVVKNLPRTAVPFQLILYLLDDAAHLLARGLRGQWGLVGATLRGWGEYARGLPRILTRRRQAWRGVAQQPVDLHGLARPFPPPQMAGNAPRLTLDLVREQLRPFLPPPENNTAPARRRLLIISPDAVQSSMGGVGMRYWELAHQLADVAEVTLAIPRATDLHSARVTLHTYTRGDAATLRPAATAADVLLLSGFDVYHHPFLRETAAYKIIDLYDPMVLENLERFADKPPAEQEGHHRLGVKVFNELFALGDFFVCATEKQRDYWLGALTAVNRVNPAAYRADPTLRRLIDLAPLGMPDAPPQRQKRVLKGVRPGIGAGDKLILWGGGLWDWLDPLTVVAAMPQVLRAVPQARLFFLGVRHPNPDVPPSRMAARTLARAAELGLLETAVFYNEWTPYAERENYLCEADVAVSLHGDHVETRFAVRTRLMDYLWARLPMVVNGGDVLGDMVQARGLGRVVETGNVTAVADALIDLLQQPISPARFEPIIEQFTWARVAEPLRRYVQQPWRNGGGGETAVSLAPVSTPLHQLPQKAWQSLRARGVSGLWQDVRSYLRWIGQQ